MNQKAQPFSKMNNKLLKRESTSLLEGRGILLFFYFYLFLRLFVANNDNLGDTINRIVVPYLNLNQGIVLFACTVILVGGLYVTNKIKTDDNVWIFIARIVLYFLPLLYVTGEYRWGVAFAVIQTMLAYYVGATYKGKVGDVVFALIAASLVLVSQMSLVVIIRNLPIFSEPVKFYMVLPAGRTNSLGAFIVVIYVIVDCFFAKQKLGVQKTVLKYSYFAFMWWGICITGTRSGLLLLAGYYLIKFIRVVFANKISWKKLSIAGGCVVAVVMLAFLIKGEEILNFLSRFNFYSLSWSRVEVYKDVFKLILQYPCFGRSAYAYQVFDATTSHNFFLESLVQTGIIGTFFYTLLWVSVIKQICKIKDKRVKVLFITFIVVTFVHGAVEPNMFSIESDTFVWFFVGVGVSISKTRSVEQDEK